MYVVKLYLLKCENEKEVVHQHKTYYENINKDNYLPFKLI